ncbi:alpha/beta fold hydrolase [Shewanella livingstonensis]|uniref:Alpha/beta hydrolase n=1 Tax=Shewanella livingstonensis TaxID=150120 RepID=A0A3G8LZH7_9GAMM|nr:alpha/beta hydrolase [Shewanella livingstonensis]AZG74847.1 alpha/beta hydrolase [Shewanella livingstonensis]
MITLSEWQQQGKFVSINGQQIFTRCSENCQAPVLLLIHGFPSASWDWEGMWHQLTQHYYVITLDMLGFGFSDKPKAARYLISEQADLYQALLQQLGVSHYHILAHDYGDTVAQELLARQIDGGNNMHIASVCFLNGGLFPETHKPILIQKLLLSPLGPLVSKLINKQKFAANLQHIFGPSTPPTPDVIDTLWQLLNHNNGLSVMHKLIGYMTQRQQNRERWVGAMVNSTIPIKLIAGALDPISGQHMIDHYRQLIPNANITTMPTLGHYPQVEDAQAMTTAYLQFRSRVNEP